MAEPGDIAIFDGHNDAVQHLMEYRDGGRDFLVRTDAGHLDLERDLLEDLAAEVRPLEAGPVARQVDDQRADLAIADDLPAQSLDTDARTGST